MYVLAACVLLAGFIQTPTPEELLQPDGKDFVLMEELRRKVESLPAERQEAEGLQILLDSVERFESAQMRKRVYLSIAKLYERCGENENALVYYRKAGMPEGDADDSSGIGAISRGHALDLLEENGDLSAVLKQALQYRDGLEVSDLEFSELTYKAGLALIQSGDAEGGVQLGIAAAIERPCNDTYESLETLAFDVGIHAPNANNAAGLRGMHWLHNNSGSFGQSWRFLGNLAHYEEEAGNVAESIEALKELVQRFPESPDTPPCLLRLARFSNDAGDDAGAKVYLTQVVEGPYSAEYKEMASRALKLMSADASPAVSLPAAAEESERFTIFLVLHVVVFCGMAAVWWWKKRPVRRT